MQTNYVQEKPAVNDPIDKKISYWRWVARNSWIKTEGRQTAIFNEFRDALMDAVDHIEKERLKDSTHSG